MTAPALIARLRFLGAYIVQVEGKPVLRFPLDIPTAGLVEEFAPHLKAHRDAVLVALGAVEHPGYVCGECKACVYTDDPEQVFRMCGRVMCPAWNRDLSNSPEWLAKARSYEAWKRREAKRLAEVEIPE